MNGAPSPCTAAAGVAGLPGWIGNAWYAACTSAELRPGSLLGRRLLGRPVVLQRRADGSVTALEDRCPHRAVPLSLGQVDADQHIVCRCHGLRFSGDGRCVHNPHGDGAIAPGLAVRRHGVRERWGLVFVWPGDAPADAARLPSFPELEPADRSLCGQPGGLRMAVPAELVIDNLMDLSHASFLHDGLLGNAEMRGAELRVSQDGDAVTVDRFDRGATPPEYFDLLWRQDGAPVDIWNTVRWLPPGHLLLHVGVTSTGTPRAAGTANWAGHFVTPETETSTLYHFVSARERPVPRSPEDNDRVMRRLAELRQTAFAGQDEPMTLAQHENLRRTHPGMTLLPIDAGAVRWRRVMQRLLQPAAGTPA